MNKQQLVEGYAYNINNPLDLRQAFINQYTGEIQTELQPCNGIRIGLYTIEYEFKTNGKKHLKKECLSLMQSVFKTIPVYEVA